MKPGLKDKIVNAAMALLETGGVKKLGQTSIARAAGLPQGHLTYYFPKRADLVGALLARFAANAVEEVQQRLGQMGADLESMQIWLLGHIAQVMKDHRRTRALLGFLVESEQDVALRTLLVQQANAVRTIIAGILQREPSDPDVTLVIATLWGLGIQDLLYQSSPEAPNVEAAIKRLPAIWAVLQQQQRSV